MVTILITSLVVNIVLTTCLIYLACKSLKAKDLEDYNSFTEL